MRKFDEINKSNLDAYNSENQNDLANGINLHMADPITRYYKDTIKGDYSIGGITVPVRFYRDFGVNVEFIKDLEQNYVMLTEMP